MASNGPVEAALSSPPATAAESDGRLAAEMSALGVNSKSEAADGQADAAVPPHRSHDPQYNMKRADPFQFGSRYLNQDDDPFEFNAWDHVETDDAYKEYAEQQYELQRKSPVSDFDKREFFFPAYLPFLLTPLNAATT